MDYLSEQNSEKESLSFLYEQANELIYLNDKKFKIFLENKIKKISFYLLFEYTKNYPEEPPLYSIIETKNLNEFIKKNIDNIIKKTIQNNLGFSMIYNIVENVREYISTQLENISMYNELIEFNSNENKKKSFSDNEDEKKHLSDDDNDMYGNYENVLSQKELCSEELRVTEEQFNEWRLKFYKDILNAINSKNNQENLSGREIFEKGKLNELEIDEDYDDVMWKNEKLFMENDLNY